MVGWQIKDRINVRWEVYRNVVNGRVDLWDDYCTLRKGVKQFVSLIFGMSLLRK